MANVRFQLQLGAITLLALVICGSAYAAGKAGSPGKSEQQDPIRSYCSNIRDLAKDARHRLHYKQLEKLSQEVDVKVRELKQRTAEYKKWYELRRKFAEMAETSLVEIYSKMRPDSAAAQISVMNRLAAAALIIKLKTRTASAILNEIEPKKAADLFGIISAAARKKTDEDPS